MNLVALTDIHDDIAGIPKMAADLEAADVVLLAGDLTNFGHKPAAERVIQAVTRFARRVLAVPGNCDYPDIASYLDDLHVSLHGHCEIIDGVALVGVGGSLPAPGTTPLEFSEAELARILAEATPGPGSQLPLVLVAHQPPFRTLSDQIHTGEHVGSTAIRSFIEERRPLICFTGHIHEAAGIDMLDQTRLVNPGPFGKGGYAYAELDNEVNRLEIRRWRG